MLSHRTWYNYNNTMLVMIRKDLEKLIWFDCET